MMQLAIELMAINSNVIWVWHWVCGGMEYITRR